MNKPEFIENFIEKVKSLDEKQTLYAFIGVLVFFFLLDFLVVMRPQLGSLSKISTENKTKSDEINKIQTELGRLNLYRNQINELKGNLEEANEQIKSRQEIPLVLEALSLMANRNDVKLDQIMPDIENQETLLETKGRRYLTIPIEIKASCGFHDFGRFLNDVESGDIYVSVSGIMITDKNGTRDNRILLTLQTIVYEEVEEVQGESS